MVFAHFFCFLALEYEANNGCELLFHLICICLLFQTEKSSGIRCTRWQSRCRWNWKLSAEVYKGKYFQFLVCFCGVFWLFCLL